jgi:hypothetical protein
VPQVWFLNLGLELSSFLAKADDQIVQHGKEIDYIFSVWGIPGTGIAKKQ